MIDRPNVTAILACHNRRAKTLACLDALARQAGPCHLRVVLFDDGCTDGTAAAVRRDHPDVEIIAGAGDGYWAGGMRVAFAAALAGAPDFVLWLNDDVQLAPDALARLLETHADRVRQGEPLCLIGGAVADPVSGHTTYAGVARPHARRPLRFEHKPPHPTEPSRCDTLVGNVVLVPRLTAETVGGLDPAFRHTLADLDYGLRVAAAGGWVGLAPGHVGWCVRDVTTGRWFDGGLPLARRWRLLAHPLGFPLRPWLHFARRHGGSRWMLYAPLPYWRLFVPARFARHVDRRRARPSGPEMRHA